jgi:regulator of replication initiation timing
MAKPFETFLQEGLGSLVFQNLQLQAMNAHLQEALAEAEKARSESQDES